MRNGLPLTRLEPDVLQEGIVEAADEVTALAERQRVADRRPGHDRNGDRADAHHERVERVLRAHQARVEQAQCRRHQQDQSGRHEHPRGVARIDLGDDLEHRSAPDRRNGHIVGLTGADAHGALEVEHEDLAVADLARLAAGAQGIDRGLDECLGDGDLEPASSRRGPPGRWSRDRSRPARAHPRGPGRDSSTLHEPRRDRAPRGRRSPSRGERSRSPASCSPFQSAAVERGEPIPGGRGSPGPDGHPVHQEPANSGNLIGPSSLRPDGGSPAPARAPLRPREEPASSTTCSHLRTT